MGKLTKDKLNAKDIFKIISMKFDGQIVKDINDFLDGLLHCIYIQRTFKCAPGRESYFFVEEGCYWAMELMVGSFGPSFRIIMA